MVFSVSPTDLNLMEDCQRCFWLDKHKVWRRPGGIFPSLPSGMDKVIKNYFDAFKKLGSLPPELARESACEGMHLFDEPILRKWQDNFNGISYVGPKGNRFRGAVDNILVHGEKLIVLDYKTRGFPLKDDSHTHYQLQLDSYNYLLRKNGYQTEDYSFLLFYIPSHVEPSGKFVFDTTLIKVETDSNRAEKRWAESLNLLNGVCPEELCAYCEGRGK